MTRMLAILAASALIPAAATAQQTVIKPESTVQTTVQSTQNGNGLSREALLGIAAVGVAFILISQDGDDDPVVNAPPGGPDVPGNTN